MTRKRTTPELVDGAIRHLKSMRQHAAALEDGTMSEEDIARLALRRVLRDLGDDSPDESSRPAVDERRQLVNNWAVPAGQALVSRDTEDDDAIAGLLPDFVHLAEPLDGITSDPSALPYRYYDISVVTRNGKPATLVVDLDWWT